jgi:hypothetical protein
VQRAGLATAGNMMSTWTVAFYDYAEQVLKAQRRFAESMWATAAPMLNVAQDMTSPEAKEGSHGSRKNELHEGENPAEYHTRSAENTMSDHITSEARAERANTQAGEVPKTRASVAASAVDRKRP